LVRHTPVPKSAFQAARERPDAQRHFETIDVLELPLVKERITLVDDFVTKGNTLLGAASRLATVHSSGTLTAFALVRTMGLRPDVDRVRLVAHDEAGELWELGWTSLGDLQLRFVWSC
jgi:hypothetical protein